MVEGRGEGLDTGDCNHGGGVNLQQKQKQILPGADPLFWSGGSAEFRPQWP